jgi:hypothetical protein
MQTVLTHPHIQYTHTVQVAVRTLYWCSYFQNLKGLSHEIFRPVFWPVWMHLGQNVNRLWFFNFKEGSSILYSYFKYCGVSYQPFSEILRISEKD